MDNLEIRGPLNLRPFRRRFGFCAIPENCLELVPRPIKASSSCPRRFNTKKPHEGRLPFKTAMLK